MDSSAPIWLPLGFADWMPATQAALLGLLTFLQEDLPAVSAALLAVAGKLPWPAGAAGIFLGIWTGDALLYLLARGAGRPMLRWSGLERLVDAGAVARSERWFEGRGSWFLFTSRFVPGSRLPTYLAAGFLRLPFGRFLVVTGLAVAIWTAGIFTLAHAVGPSVLHGLKQWSTFALPALLLLALVILAGRVLAKCVRGNLPRRMATWIRRWRHWEFWPAWLFYAPVAVHYLRLAIRHRGLTLPTAANPGIFSGGFVGESKFATIQDLQVTSPEFIAPAFLLPPAADDPASSRLAEFEQRVMHHAISFPCIVKPDVGQRGVGVKLVRSRDQAADYLRQTRAALIVQRYAPGPHEIGVFYFRFPGERRGQILAITEKIFPHVVGDGHHTLEELIWRDSRARYLAQKYLSRLAGRREEVPADGEVVKLVESGNHAQGCVFLDGWRLWSEALERRIDEISQRLEGFYIGRYDIRYSSESELRAGTNFEIVELNGAASEATSIYDARNTLSAAYRMLFRQWELVFAIGAENRRRGCAPTAATTLWRRWRETCALVATYPAAD